jgi:hypothetical protein
MFTLKAEIELSGASATQYGESEEWTHVHPKSGARTVRCSGGAVLIIHSNMSYDLHGGVNPVSSDSAVAVLMCVYGPTTWAHLLEHRLSPRTWSY